MISHKIPCARSFIEYDKSAADDFGNIQVTDKVIGLTLVGGATALFFYYTLWVIALPFVDKDQEVIHSWFPNYLYALGIPLLAGTAGLIFIGVFVAVVLVKSKSKGHTD